MDEVHDEDDTYWDNLDDMDLNGFINGLLSCATSKSDGSDIKQMAPVRCTAIITIGGIYDPDADILDNPDISQHVILIHGDLGTGEHLQSAQL
ncbi:hypothetical protein BDR04DRAFT_1164364 [Suillus decipiens]|nr:hypothetical protein BDR04DRAFT_1164364 [Suillus decipiens]